MSWTSLIAPLVQAGTSVYGAYTANQAGRQQQQAANQASAAQLQAAERAAQLQADAVNRASQVQQGTADQQLNLLAQMYNQNRTDQAPYRAAGEQGLNAYAQNLQGDFRQTPGYQYQQQEGMRAVMANAAANRHVNSGATLRALQDRGMNIADQGYGQYMNRLAALGGIGQTAAGATGAAGQAYGQNAAGVMGQNAAALGQYGIGGATAANQYGLSGQTAANQYNLGGAGAAATGQIGGANALMGGANNLLAYYMQGR